ncbi:MAG TPA: hypothetical protein VFY14_02235 [Streptomyces sp.]|nr:hypothetical protein [Streptomyces sp.]
MLDYELYRLHSADLRREAERERLTRTADTSRRRARDDGEQGDRDGEAVGRWGRAA